MVSMRTLQEGRYFENTVSITCHAPVTVGSAQSRNSRPPCGPNERIKTVVWTLLSFSHSVVSDSLRPQGPQHGRPLCPPLSPRVCSNSPALSQWCSLTTSPSAAPFSFCLQSLLASGSFPMNQLFASGSQSTGASDPASVLLTNIQDWFQKRKEQ